MFKLITVSSIIPRSLFIRTEVDLGPEIAAGGFGRVFKGEYAGQPVALKMLTRAGQTAEVSRTPASTSLLVAFNCLQRVHSKKSSAKKLLPGDRSRIALSFLCWGYM